MGVPEPMAKGWNRLWLCVVCVLLLWMTTLETAVRVTREFLMPPHIDTVIETCGEEYMRVDRQRRDYEQCVDNQVGVCERDLDGGIQGELHRSSNASKTNEEILREALNRRNAAKRVLEQIKVSIGNYLHVHADANIVLGYNFGTQCSPAERQDAQDLVNDMSDVTAPISENTEYFTNRANQRVDHLATHVTAVNQYNNDYVSNKTSSLHQASIHLMSHVLPPKLNTIDESIDTFQELFQVLLLCLSLDEGSSKMCEYSEEHNSAYDLYTQIETSMNAQLIAISTAFAEIGSDIEDWKNDVAVSIANAEGFFAAVDDVMGVVRSDYGISQLCGLTSPDWCDFVVHDFYVDFNAVTIPQPNLNFMADASAIWDPIAAAAQTTTNEINDLISHLSDELEDAASDTIMAISELDFTPSDYNPPSYGYAEDANDETSNQQQEGIAFNENITSLLGSFSGQNNTANVTGQDIDTDVADIPLSSIIKSEVSSAWASFSNDKLDLSRIIQGATTVEALLVIFDLIYRVLQTLRIVRKHWNGSLVELPVVNWRKDDSNWSERICNSLAYIDSVGTFTAITIVFLAIIIYVVVSIYTTSLLSYRSACVTESSNTTYVMRGMYSLAFNYASIQGNFALSNGVSAHNHKAASQCMVYSEASKAEYQHFVQQMHLSNSTYLESVGDVDVISRCVAWDHISTYYKSNCCHYAHYRDAYDSCATIHTNSTCAIDPFTSDVLMPPSYYANQIPTMPTYTESIDVGKAAIFSCDSLPACSITCSGPDDSIIRASAQMCACSAEWYVHGSIIQVLFMCIIYVAMNVSRTLITRGMGMVLWRHLQEPKLECRIECSEQGNIVDTSESEERSPQMEDDEEGQVTSIKAEVGEEVSPPPDSKLKNDIEKALSSFVWAGYVHLLAGILMNAAWMSALPFIDDTITYRPNEANL